MQKAAIALLALVWVGSLALGVDRLMAYERRPGARLAAGPEWPRDSRLTRLPGQPTLVIAVHPKCPCTAATFDELITVLSRAPGTAGIVLFARPSGLPSSWAHTSLWEKVKSLPGWTPVEDEGGIESARFGASTSGHVLVYDATGRLRFSGGITSARGARGGSAGADAVLALLSGRPPAFERTPVFGCPLNDSEGDR